MGSPFFSTHTESLHWLAGLLDGEGSFGYQYKQGHHGNFRVGMGSRDEDVIDRVLLLFGGYKYVEDLKGKPFYKWNVNGDMARQLSIDLYPLLCKRRQGQIALALYNWWTSPVGNKDKTHCKNGHEFTQENTIRNACDQGRRRCRVCRTKAQRVAGAKRKEAKGA